MMILGNYEKIRERNNFYRLKTEIKENIISNQSLDRKNIFPGGFTKKTRKQEKTIIKIKNKTTIGGGKLSIIANPPTIKSEKEILKTAKFIKSCGISILDSGCFTPQTTHYNFNGSDEKQLKLFMKAGEKYNLAIITEVINVIDVDLASSYADILQISERNVLNYSLLKKIGKINKPVLLKRGRLMTLKELLMAAEYIMAEGNINIILCERGRNTFDVETKNTLDISTIALLKEKTHLPVIADPAPATEKENLIFPLSMAAIAAGADGLIIKYQHDLNNFQSELTSLHKIVKEINRTL
jgi:3-deoxy-7-phosphoheptulonate synthase